MWCGRTCQPVQRHENGWHLADRTTMTVALSHGVWDACMDPKNQKGWWFSGIEISKAPKLEQPCLLGPSSITRDKLGASPVTMCAGTVFFDQNNPTHHFVIIERMPIHPLYSTWNGLEDVGRTCSTLQYWNNSFGGFHVDILWCTLW